MKAEPYGPAVPISTDLPPEAIPFLQSVGYMDADRLKVGDAVPPLTLRRLHGGDPITLGRSAGGRPVVLIFGSYT